MDVFIFYIELFLGRLNIIDLFVIVFLTVLFIFIFMLPFRYYFLSFTCIVSSIYISCMFSLMMMIYTTSTIIWLQVV